MGVWAGGGPGDPTAVDIPGMAAAMRPVLEEWFTGRIQIIDNHRLAPAGPRFNPYTDAGGSETPTLVWDSGVNGALIQPIRDPARIQLGGQPNNLQAIRFQVKAGIAVESGQALRGGLQVLVLDGGNTDSYAGAVFSLGDISDTSLMWDHIYVATYITGGLA